MAHRSRILCGWAVLTSLVQFGCKSENTGAPGTPPPQSAELPAEVSPPPAGATTGYPEVCTSDGSFDFGVTGAELESHEGKRVWAVAVQRPEGEGPGKVVRLESRISNGRFDLGCPGSLEEDNNYPSWTVVIDADDDGKCSPADRQRTTQLYGWGSDIVVDVTRDAVGKVWDWRTTVADAHTVVGDRSTFDFCRYYFDAPAP